MRWFAATPSAHGVDQDVDPAKARDRIGSQSFD